MNSVFSNLRRDQSGATAIIFALACVAVLLVLAVAFDLQRTMSNSKHAQSALDAAALAGARALEDSTASDADITRIARAAFEANMLTRHVDFTCGAATVTIDRNAGNVDVDAACEFPTTFANLASVKRVEINRSAAAKAAITKLDVALMLDVSGSMKGGKLADLKESAKDAIDLLITDATGNRVRVGFNTYSTSVNAGIYADRVIKLPSWMPTKTCVSERTGSAAWTDAAPGLGTWLGLDATSCPSSSVEPLTSDAARLKGEIDKLAAAGNTAGHLGVAWAWYLVSPEWDDVWPAASRPLAYGEENTKKAVVLMTDGEFNTVYEWSQGSSAQQARKLCGAMRDKGIIVYSVAFNAPKSAQKTLENCAGDASRYFEAENGDELKLAYLAIASQLSNLALTE